MPNESELLQTLWAAIYGPNSWVDPSFACSMILAEVRQLRAARGAERNGFLQEQIEVLLNTVTELMISRMRNPRFKAIPRILQH